MPAAGGPAVTTDSPRYVPRSGSVTLTAVGLEVRRDRLGNVAAIEGVRPSVGQAFERARQVGLDEQVADPEQVAVARVYGLRRRRGLDALAIRHHVRAVIRRPVAVHVAGDSKAVAGERDGRLDGLRPGDRAVPRQRLMQPRHRAGDAHRSVADVVHPAFEHVSIPIGGLAQKQALPLVLSRS